MKKLLRTIIAIAAILLLIFYIKDLFEKNTTSETKSLTNYHYIANKNSGKLHSINCSSLPYEYNRIYFETIDAAHKAGYTDHHVECMGN